jgi:hypothetical protein
MYVDDVSCAQHCRSLAVLFVFLILITLYSVAVHGAQLTGRVQQ